MIEVDQQINAVRRQVGSRVLEAGEACTVTISRAMDPRESAAWVASDEGKQFHVGQQPAVV